MGKTGAKYGEHLKRQAQLHSFGGFMFYLIIRCGCQLFVLNNIEF